ncbi:MAG: hypothetical protein HQK50_16530 [Oligoflexia bacterium]|nr:hypothetical protein [Oligoflexia bacterium]MBF0367184.1 hypothetical protein [Oligoflexia bacterium]
MLKRPLVEFAMVIFMPKKIWIPNLDDLGPSFDPDIASAAESRYLWFLNEGDLAVLSRATSDSFLKYLSKFIPSLASENILFPISTKSGERKLKLVNSILADRSLLQKLKELAKQRTDLYLASYIASPSILQLSEVTGIPLDPLQMPTRPFISGGLTYVFNSKSKMKLVANELAIPFIAYSVANSYIELEKSVYQLIKSHNPHKLILKKALSGGGHGNYSGTPENVLSIAQTWYREECEVAEEILIEPYMNFKEIIGALAYVSEDNIYFHGIDKQLIENDGWSGMIYPYINEKWGEQIKNWTLKFASRLQNAGGRGWFNLDFATYLDSKGCEQVVFMESNFRCNGFALMLEIAKKTQQKGRIYYSSTLKKEQGNCFLLDEYSSQYVSFEH